MNARIYVRLYTNVRIYAWLHKYLEKYVSPKLLNIYQPFLVEIFFYVFINTRRKLVKSDNNRAHLPY